MTSVCEKLKKQQNELRRNSIYFLNSNANDRDFEQFVLIDPGPKGKRCDFLQELHQVLIRDRKSFAASKHKSELQQWLGSNDEQNRVLTPLNWLKIEIENYPYRLFVVVEPEIWQKNGATVFDNTFWNDATIFLKKRICWIDVQEFREKIEKFKNELLQLKFWFMRKWITHICINLLGFRLRYSDALVLYFSQLYERNGGSYRPATLPSRLDIGHDQKKMEELAEKQDPLYRLNLFDDRNLEKIDNDAIEESDHILFFSRHRDFFEKVDNPTGKQQPEKINASGAFSAKSFEYLAPQVFYSESLSGSLSHFLRIVMALERDQDENSQLFLLQLIEQSLLRIAIVDERIQQKYAQLEDGRAAGIYQSRILVSYLGEPGRYGQKRKPGHRPYAKIPIRVFRPVKGKGNNFVIPNVEHFEQLWPESQRGIDVIVIHQGILDKWKKDDNYARYMLALKDKFPFVIITSGRGIPANLPKGIKFLPFSGLETCFVGNYFEKLTLVRQLFSLV